MAKRRDCSPSNVCVREGDGPISTCCRRTSLRPRKSELAAGVEGKSKPTKRTNGRKPYASRAASGGKRKVPYGVNNPVSNAGGRSSGRKGQSRKKRSRLQISPVVLEEELIDVPEEMLPEPVQQGQRQVVDMEGEPTEDYQYIPGLDDDLALLCLARLPRADHERFRMVNRKFHLLARSGYLYKIRKRNGIAEQWVYMVATGQFDWQAFDPKSKRWRRLPPFEADSCYHSGDKESFSVGTQLLVVGHSVEGLVLWRYDLVSNRWGKGKMMLTPRCLYGWASCGSYAYVAGGVTPSGEILQSAERYDPDREEWEILPDLHQPRKLCSGCYMDGKFYLLGGTGTDGELTSAEVYDPIFKTWKLVPNMLPREGSRSFTGAPPLIAVVKNELYTLEAESNMLKVYVKASNSWKALGEAPVRADLVSGWGIAFKSLGEQLLVVGGARTPQYEDGMYVCSPDPESGPVRWDFLSRLCPFGPFVLNCAIVSA